jgi:hypothetical protein
MPAKPGDGCGRFALDPQTCLKLHDLKWPKPRILAQVPVMVEMDGDEEDEGAV